MEKNCSFLLQKTAQGKRFKLEPSKFKSNLIKIPNCKNSRAVEQAAWSGSGVSTLGDFQQSA